MGEQHTEIGLPPLQQEDFFEAGLDLIIDADVRDTFHEIRNTNPALAREILLAAHLETTESLENTTITSTLRAHIGIVKAIERALKRDQPQGAAAIDVGDEGSQPSVA